MRWLTWIALLGVLGFGRGVLAQEAEAWPPDPNAIFAEGVVWSVIEAETEAITPVELDYDRQVIRVFDEETELWREYPYPVPDHSLNVSMLPSGLVSVQIHNERGGDALPGELFLLDPDTGVYTEPPTVCEGKIIQAEAGAGKWVAAHHDEAERQAFLCHSETGEQREALPSQPEGTEWKVYTNESQTHLLFIGKNPNFEDGQVFKVYSYRLIDEQLTLLGSLDWGYGDFTNLCGWVSNTQGLVCSSGSSSWMGVNYNSFDLTQANSLKRAFYGWREDTFRLEDPARYVSADTARYGGARTGNEAGDAPCTVSMYDATGFRQHEIGADCIPLLIDPNNIAPAYRHGNTLYFLTQTDRNSTVSRIIRFDMDQETMTEVGPFAAEIENIVSVSPDGRYIVLLVDNNNTLDFPWEAYETRCCHITDGWLVTIFDLEAQDMVYQSESIGVYAATQVTWLDNTTVVMGAATTYKELRAAELPGDSTWYSGAATLRQIQLDDFITTKIIALQEASDHDQYGADGLDSPNQRYWIYRRNSTVIDLMTLEPVPLFQEGILETYLVWMHWDKDESLIVSVSSDEDRDASIAYRVVLPNSAKN